MVFVAILGRRKKNRPVRSIKIRHGEHTAVFTRGDLARPLDVLLRHEPLALMPQTINAHLKSPSRRCDPPAAHDRDPCLAPVLAGARTGHTAAGTDRSFTGQTAARDLPADHFRSQRTKGPS
jgi:hypothetical protein